MNSAREIAEMRLAKGEITEEEFTKLLNHLQSSEPTHQRSTTNATQEIGDSSARSNSTVNSAPPAQSAPEMVRHYLAAQYLTDLKIPAKIVHYSAKIAIFIYVAYFVALFRSRDDESTMSGLLQFYTVQDADPDPSLAIVYIMMGLPELICGIAGLVWIFRATRNLFHKRVSALRYSPGWSVGWFFIPGAFFFMPFNALQQLVRATRYGDSWQSMPTESTTTIWWFTFLLSWIVSYAIPSSVAEAGGPATALVIFGIYVALSATSLGAFAEIVSEVTEKQQSNLA